MDIPCLVGIRLFVVSRQNRRAALKCDYYTMYMPLPNENSFPSPDDDANLDDAPPQYFQHFKSSKSLHDSQFTFIYILSYLSSQILSEQLSLLVAKLQKFVIVSSESFLEVFHCLRFSF